MVDDTEVVLNQALAFTPAMEEGGLDAHVATFHLNVTGRYQLQVATSGALGSVLSS